MDALCASLDGIEHRSLVVGVVSMVKSGSNNKPIETWDFQGMSCDLTIGDPKPGKKLNDYGSMATCIQPWKAPTGGRFTDAGPVTKTTTQQGNPIGRCC